MPTRDEAARAWDALPELLGEFRELMGDELKDWKRVFAEVDAFFAAPLEGPEFHTAVVKLETTIRNALKEIT